MPATKAELDALNNRRNERVLEYFKTNPDSGTPNAARALGLSRGAVRRALVALRKLGSAPADNRDRAALVTLRDLPPTEKGARKNGDQIDLVTDNPCTLEDLLTATRVDLSLWRVARWVANKWEVGTKNVDGTVLRTPLYQIKAWLEPIPGVAESNVVKETLEWVRANSPIADTIAAHAAPAVQADDPHLLEVNIPDLHLDKLCWGPESGEDYDMKIASGMHYDAVQSLALRASPFPIVKALYVIGNDFFTANSADNKTAAGTPQVVDGRWQKSFRQGIAVHVAAIEFLRRRYVGGVDVVVVPGNHDPERMFYAACVLEAMYAGKEGVSINNAPNPRKYYRWGVTLLGFTHGHGEKPDKLPIIMAGEAAGDWAQTTHREWHLGHFHHKRETAYHVGNEFGPVRVRILPALCAADAWHHQSGYVGAQRAAEGYLWSFKRGYVGHLSWGPN